MSDGITIGPKQIKNPEAVMARIKLEAALGNSVDFVPCGWKYIRAALEELTEPEVVNGALVVIKKLTDDCRYNRSWGDTRAALVPVLHKVLPYATDLQAIVELVDLICYNRQQTYLTYEQMLGLVGLSRKDVHRQWNLHLLLLQSVNIFHHLDVVDKVGAENQRHGWGEFSDQVYSLKLAAIGVGAPDAEAQQKLYWPAAKRLWQARMHSDYPVDNCELAQFFQRWKDEVSVVVEDGQFTVRLEPAPKGKSNEPEKETVA